MNTEWMGRYRPLLAALVRHSNITQRSSGTRTMLTDEISLNAQEWQVFEYIIEHMEDDAYMNLISDRLGIPQSTFSKIVKALCLHGLVDKYLTSNNRKNIILRPSEKGLSVYQQHSQKVLSAKFEPFFEMLDSFSDEQIARFTDALDLLNSQLLKGNDSTSQPVLIKKVRKET